MQHEACRHFVIKDMTQCRTLAHIPSAQAVSRCSQLRCTLADVTRQFILSAYTIL